MLREQRIMERIVNEIGDEFNEYIETFYVCDLWKIKEGELIVNKTFKKIIEIIADFNLTSYKDIMSNAYNLIESNQAMLSIMQYLCNDFIKNGSDSLLNRAMIFCYCVFMISDYKKISATEVLNNVIESEILKTKSTWWCKLKHKIGLIPRPYSIKGDPDALSLISLLKGSPVTDVIVDVAVYKYYI